MISDTVRTGIPADLHHGVAAQDAASVCDWWAQLAEEKRREIVELWDSRQDSCRFAAVRDERGPTKWHSLPLVIGRFGRRKNPEAAEWHADHAQYLWDRPEVDVLQTIRRRTVGVCTRHPAARAALAAGVIPADFACPFASEDCPMRRILGNAPGKSLYLSLRNTGSQMPDASPRASETDS